MPDLALILPVLILALSALVLVPYAAFTEDARGTTILAALASLIAAGAAWFYPVTGAAFQTPGGPLVLVTPITHVTWLALFLLFPFVLALVPSYFAQHKPFKPEFPILMLLSLTGMGLLAAAHDFLTLYVGLELMSFPLYILCAFVRDDARSSEAGLKYFILGALASGLLLFGISLAYATTGSTNFTAAITTVVGQGSQPLGAVSMALILLAMLFKLSVVPFHVWTPDAYQGAPTPTTAFLGTLPKLVMLMLLVRLLNLPFASQHDLWQPIVIVLSVASMVLGSAVAVVQHNLKRLLAYSTIGNVGFMLVGIDAASASGTAGVLFYAIVYLVNTIGLFAFLGALGKAHPTVDDIKGLAKTRPYLTAAFTVNLLSLAGIPPLAGFMGKLNVFAPAVSTGHPVLAVTGFLASAIALFYSLYLIKLSVFDAPNSTVTASKMPWELTTVLALSVIIALVLGLYPQPLLLLCQTAAAGLY